MEKEILNQDNENGQLVKLVQAAMLAALSIILMIVVRFPLFPAAPWLEYDMADVPVLIGGLILGPSYGFAILLVTCALQAFTVSASAGVWGFIMHLVASGALVLVSSVLYKKLPGAKGLILGLILGAISMVALMMPLNIFITPLYSGAPREAVIEMIVPILLPFNALKACINAAVSGILYVPLITALKGLKLAK